MEDRIMIEQIDLFNRSVKMLGLQDDVCEQLEKCGYHTIGQLADVSMQHLKMFDGFDWPQCIQIKTKLEAIGIELKNEDELSGLAPHCTIYKQEYPTNLIVALLGKECAEEFELEKERIRGLAVALTFLREREVDMLMLRYKHHNTLEKIGSYYDLTRERVRQILAATLRKLRAPRLSQYYFHGFDAYISQCVTDEVEKRLDNVAKSEYMRGYDTAIEDVKANRVEGLTGTLMIRILSKPLEDMDLSIRAYTILKRIGVNTIGDLLQYDTDEKIVRIRGLGKNRAKEIALKLRSEGVLGTAWDSFADG